MPSVFLSHPLCSLKGLEQEWREHVAEYSSNNVLVANCVAASAFLVYCGAMNTDMRRRMGQFFMTICEHHGLPLPNKQLFRNLEIINFLYSGVSVVDGLDDFFSTWGLRYEYSIKCSINSSSTS
jgi:hypothetical protein